MRIISRRLLIGMLDSDDPEAASSSSMSSNQMAATRVAHYSAPGFPERAACPTEAAAAALGSLPLANTQPVQPVQPSLFLPFLTHTHILHFPYVWVIYIAPTFAPSVRASTSFHTHIIIYSRLSK